MSYMKKWGLLYKIYKETNRAGLIKSLHKNKSFSQSWRYKITFVVYVALSIWVFYLSSKIPACLLFVIPLIFGIYFWLELLIYWEYKEIYQTHNLQNYPFFQRTKNLSYILFSNKLSENNLANTEKLKSMIEWQGAKNERYSSLSYFSTPIILILLTASSSLLLEYLKSNNLIVTKYILPIVIIIFLIIWFGWALFDTLKSSQRINLEICQYLKCYRIENT